MTFGGQALILVVDDDQDFLDINRAVLERAGYRVGTAADVSQALARLESETPDLVITDLMMTGLNSGLSFAQNLKTQPRLATIPVILVTSMSSTLGIDLRPQSEQELACMNADAFFEKPLDPALLLAKITELLQADKRRGETGLAERSRAT
jgi:CheY-like chemotaxis protein